MNLQAADESSKLVLEKQTELEKLQQQMTQLQEQNQEHLSQIQTIQEQNQLQISRVEEKENCINQTKQELESKE